MKNRFCSIGKTVFGAFLLLSVSGISYSCSDDYDLDTTKPGFLGGSIYDELKSNKYGKFDYTLQLIRDLDYIDVMSKTGSKTLFVAPDEAYEAFFKNNPWGVKSYADLTKAQKHLLFNGMQLNNAYVVEMMANCDNGEKNLCLRQNAAMAVTDSVPFWKNAQLPVNYNQDDAEEKYWKRHAASAAGGIYMVADATVPMMTHFLEGQLKEKSIKHSDIAFVLNDAKGWEEDKNRSYIFDAQISKQDVVCLNGYFHVLDKVVVPPGNMAEVIRTNGETNIFSHILDRFSAPFYNKTLTANFRALYGEKTDSVFEKRYFAVNTRDGRLVTDPNGLVNNEFPLLSFDPGWNAYQSSSTEEKEKDMGAMFVPNDEAMKRYFLPGGGGYVLLERYAIKKPVTESNLIYNLDQIPLNVIQALVNNLMKNSFNETVPSKYYTIMNDARDQMFPVADYPSEEAYKSVFTKTLLANNGVVYVMNRVMTPADYASVIAPALYNENAQVVRTVVRADDSFIQGDAYNQAPLKQYFSTYLKAMQSRFSFFIPSDAGLATYGYVDPVAYTKNANSRLVYKWIYSATISNKDDKRRRIPIWAQAFRYDSNTGLPTGVVRNGDSSRPEQPLDQAQGHIKQQLLIEMVNQHIVVHGDKENKGINSGRKYYLSREGAPVVLKNNLPGVGLQLNGGFQEQLAGTPTQHNCVVEAVYDQTAESNGYGNGMTYLLNRPMQPTTMTTYKAIQGLGNATQFLQLCEGVTDEILESAGFKDSINASNAKPDVKEQEWQRVAAKYYIFLRGDKGGSSFNVPRNDKLVRFFNNYRYTVYIPDDASVTTEIAKGLPTWVTIKNYLDTNKRPEVKLLEDKSNQALVDATNQHNNVVKAKAQAMIVTLVNFLKYHFQDETVFVDNVSEDPKSYMTSCVDEVNKVYLPLVVTQTPNRISIQDRGGSSPVSVNTSHCNILVRDANFNKLDGASYITNSSYAVVHQINRALVFDKSLSSRYDKAWASPKKAKAFVAKFKIKD